MSTLESLTWGRVSFKYSEEFDLWEGLTAEIGFWSRQSPPEAPHRVAGASHRVGSATRMEGESLQQALYSPDFFSRTRAIASV